MDKSFWNTPNRSIASKTCGYCQYEQDEWTSKYESYGRFGMTSAYGMVVSCGSAKTRWRRGSARTVARSVPHGRRLSIPPPTKDAARDQHCLLCPAMSRCFGHLAPTPSHTSSSAVVAPVTRDTGAPPAIATFLAYLPSCRVLPRPAASSSYPTTKSYPAIIASFARLPSCEVVS